MVPYFLLYYYIFFIVLLILKRINTCFKINIIKQQKTLFLPNYWYKKTYSGQFYSKGNAKLVIKSKNIDSILEFHEGCLFVIDKKNLKDMPTYFKVRLTFLESNYNTSVFEYNKNSK